MTQSDLKLILKVVQNINNYKVYNNISSYLISIGCMYQEKQLYEIHFIFFMSVHYMR